MRLWHRLTGPFRTQVWIFEDTRIEYRSFPPKFKHARIESLRSRVERARLAGGGRVDVGNGTHVLYEPLMVGSGPMLLAGEGERSRLLFKPDGA